MGQLRIEVTQSELAPEITVLRFEGDLDNASIKNISSCFQLVLEKNTSYAVADMSRVTMLSSAALGELMGGRKALVEHGGDLVLACLALNIKTKLSLLGANKIFRFHNDIRSAINAYKWEFEGKSEVFSLSFPPDLRFVPSVRQLASRLASQKGYTRRDAFRIETIVDEICNNAIEHAPQGWDKNVDLSIGIDRKKVEINVVNASDPDKLKTLKNLLNPAKGTPPPSSASDKRGRGLALVKLLSTELNIDFSEHGTSVHATKLREE
jgi:anti-anti-sigma factor